MKRTVLAASLLILITLVIWGSFYFFRSERNPNELILYGNVDVRLVDIGFRVPGRVGQLFFEEGDLVPRGTLMTTLDKTPYDSQVRQAAANLESISASFQNAEKLLKRRQELIGIGGVSQEDLDNAQASRDEWQANLLAAEAALAASLDNLAYTEAFAPTDGVILTRVREPGTVVNAADPVYTLSVTSPVWIRAFVDEPHLGQVYYGMPAEIFTDTQGAVAYTGKVGFISPMAEFTPKTVETTQLRTDLVYRLRIYADNPDKGLKQGMPVTVKLKLENTAKQEKR
ncbi:MAG: efflux RND transporter periplasmic adaptor subunit [Anaerolineae bacterium]